MLIKLSKNSFVRCTEKYGYIINQLTKHDRCYNAQGAEWLKMIKREPQDVDVILDKLVNCYPEVDRKIIEVDLCEFIESLVVDKFVIVGNTIEDLNKNDIDFSYSLNNPKTLTESYHTESFVSKNTQDFFLEEFQGKPLISNLQFELSSRCNERCIHCYIPNSKKNSGFDMPIHKVKSIINEFSELGGISVTLSGGEVFLHKDLMEIVDYCREKDLIISILSNLISLKDEHIPHLKNANISLIQVSLYSMDSEKHDAITTVNGSFLKTKTAIEKLVAADIPVQISCPIMKANRYGYNEVLSYAESLNVKAQTDFILMARSDLDTDNLANRLSLSETEELLRDIILHDINYRTETLSQQSLSEEQEENIELFKKKPICGVGYDNCCITANGDVYPCAGWQDYVLGNVYKQTLKDIWESSERVIALRHITQESFPQCMECSAKDYCSFCLVRNYNESGGDMFKINQHFCDVAFLNKKIVEEYKKKGLL
ncbi:MAG: radical SAM protein [Muribaculaceae bacterium]|nr:radical SAM protein [Muribaculaceae bacterium]